MTTRPGRPYLKTNHDITSRLTQLANVLDGFDPWYDLDYDNELDDLESEFAGDRPAKYQEIMPAS